MKIATYQWQKVYFLAWPRQLLEVIRKCIAAATPGMLLHPVVTCHLLSTQTWKRQMPAQRAHGQGGFFQRQPTAADRHLDCQTLSSRALFASRFTALDDIFSTWHQSNCSQPAVSRREQDKLLSKRH